VSTTDLSKLTISRDQKAFSGKKTGRKKWWIIAAIIVVIGGAAVALRGGGGTQQVESGIVASAYPSTTQGGSLDQGDRAPGIFRRARRFRGESR